MACPRMAATQDGGSPGPGHALPLRGALARGGPGVPGRHRQGSSRASPQLSAAPRRENFVDSRFVRIVSGSGG